MNHPFSVLRPEYEQLIATMQVDVDRAGEVDRQARFLVRDDNLLRYEGVERETRVPAVAIAALDMRESSADPRKALGQGDLWNKVSTHVPKGFGPFESWKAAAVFYVRYDHLDQITIPRWTLAYAAWKAEGWNGFGPRAHGIHTGYLWAATNHYAKGKYPADGRWDPDLVDKQIGVMPLMARMAALRPELKFWGDVDPVAAPGPAAQRPPMGVGSVGLHDVAWLQDALNKVELAPHDDEPLLVDGSFGRRTRAALRQFQASHHLDVDGLFGPKTDAALTASLVG